MTVETILPPKAKVYVSGKITGLTEAEFTQNFKRSCTLLQAAGFVPVNPVDIKPACKGQCDSGFQFEDGSYKHSWKCYMASDIKVLVDCDAIYMQPDWEDSSGAKLELQIALGLKFPVLFVSESEELMVREYE